MQIGQIIKGPGLSFLKVPLIRKYGEAFYETLEAVAQEYFKEKNGMQE